MTGTVEEEAELLLYESIIITVSVFLAEAEYCEAD